MSIGILSLILLILAIIIGFFCKTNVGLISLCFALILSKIAGISAVTVLKGFNPNLFITLMGVSLLFSILNNNGTIKLLAQKIVSLAGKNNYLIPIAIYLIGLLLTTIGPGSLPILAIMPAFAIPIAKAHGYNPLMLSMIGCAGCFSGRLSTITPEGILTYDYLLKYGIPSDVAVKPMYTAEVITGALLAIIIFLFYKGYKVDVPTEEQKEEVQEFNPKQILSLMGLIVMAVLVIAFRYHVGLTCFAVSAILITLHVGNEMESMRSIPWGVLLMISGVSTLMGLVIDTGGIKILTHILSTIMNQRTAPAVMAATAGLMSLFSSALGVVFPTLFPTVGEIGQSVGVSPLELMSMVFIGGTITGYSPISTTGGLIIATMMSMKDSGYKGTQMDLFIELTVWAVAILVLLTIVALTGFYGLIFR